ncbi:hypothetical protein BIW11_08704 [Tropilaelaps mercedesae]|uniref:Uncharacterized protein n=1 Tax=Tropilaelaps mercedesae TaxID=418985 RepID=A0A1V9XNS2_9ACAR|nr:hypothetical protein BIW11_08704 [Tropilaelaps mercedesae]
MNKTSIEEAGQATLVPKIKRLIIVQRNEQPNEAKVRQHANSSKRKQPLKTNMLPFVNTNTIVHSATPTPKVMPMIITRNVKRPDLPKVIPISQALMATGAIPTGQTVPRVVRLHLIPHGNYKILEESGTLSRQVAQPRKVSHHGSGTTLASVRTRLTNQTASSALQPSRQASAFHEVCGNFGVRENRVHYVQSPDKSANRIAATFRTAHQPSLSPANVSALTSRMPRGSASIMLRTPLPEYGRPRAFIVREYDPQKTSCQPDWFDCKPHYAPLQQLDTHFHGD